MLGQTEEGTGENALCARIQHSRNNNRQQQRQPKHMYIEKYKIKASILYAKEEF